MAIFPYHSTTIINKDVLTASSFKAGMALIIDSNGRAVKADSQQLISTSVQEKYARFLGFAASDHDLSGNTLIVPDVIGSSYLDINNRFINNQNLEYSVPKRALMDLQDTAVSNFYNLSDPNVVSKRGIGVYNTPGDIFITDQFVPVLHGDYGLDNISVVSISPGDLLTFGGGINAGKLVKVNVNSIGPDVLIVAIVEKYIPETGLLHFRQASYRLSLGNSFILYLEPDNPNGFVDATTLRNFANSSQNMPLYNGPTRYSNYIYFDGTNDHGYQSSFSYSTGQYTYLVWLMTDGTQDRFDGILGSVPDRPNMLNLMFSVNNNLGYSSVGSFSESGTISVVDQTWTLASVSFGTSSTIVSSNLNFEIRGPAGIPSLSNMYLALDPLGRYFKGRIGLTSIVNRALTQTEITNYYNATRGRYGV
jgi:hypothetical protein